MLEKTVFTLFHKKLQIYIDVVADNLNEITALIQPKHREDYLLYGPYRATLYRDDRIALNSEIFNFGINCKYGYISKQFKTQLTSKSLKIIRESMRVARNNVCAICKREIKNPTLDHSHRKRVGGSGNIRGVICSNCNVFIAKIENNCNRYGISKEMLPAVLQNCAEYLQSERNALHPTEKPKREMLKKREWNKIVKYYFKLYPLRKKLPKKPKYKTVQIKKLLNEIESYIQKQKQKPKSQQNRRRKYDT